MRRITLLLLLCASIKSQLLAQEKCATVTYMQNLQDKRGIPEHTQQFEEWIQKKINQRDQFRTSNALGVPTFRIPVVVHVIHNGQSVGTDVNITDARILSQIDVLNKDFNRLNTDANQTPADFLPVAGGLNIEFVLAKQTPEGLSTNGIVRVNGNQSAWSISEDEELKNVSYWPSEDYLNIWVTKLSGVFIGYAQFPVSNLPGLEDFQDGLAATDGVVIDYRCFGVGSEDSFYNLGRTTTHEVGHFFGLRHIWGDENGCAGTDYVSDTPNQEDATLDCSALVHPVADNCSSMKMYQNYMDYTDDVCLNLFTQGQVSRMSTIMNDVSIPRRNSLLTSHGLNDANCGSDPPVDVAIQSIIQPGPVTCNNNPSILLSIENVSCPIVTSLKIEYEINNGPTQSTTISGLSIFPNSGGTTIDARALELVEGENTISLRVLTVNNKPDADASNSDTTVTITLNTSTDIIPLIKNFDNNMLGSWTAANPQDGTRWNVESELARFSGIIGEESWLASPTLDLKNVQQASLFFNLAYTGSESNNDRLRILISTNCGDTYFETSFKLEGTELGDATGKKQYLLLNSLAGTENVRVAFVANTALGSNIDVDNIEFFTSDDETPVDPGNKAYAIYWNEQGGVNITFNLPERETVNLTMFDIMGREAFRAELPDILNQTIPIGTGNIQSGLYIIRVQIGKKYYATKVYISL